MLRAAALVSLVAVAAGHGAMVTPRSRNSVDWMVGVNTQRCSNVTGDKCENGQAAFWYSQGCFIGCDKCDQASGRRQVDLCGLGKKQTLTDPKYWTVNRDAVPFSANDIYQHNPWRAPGSAPVDDACGVAGGANSRHSGAEAGDFTLTKFAQHGDHGTAVLKPLPGYTPPVYKRGGTAEVAWQVRNHHGGGYQYRLCPLPKGNFTDLKEECFQQHPLDFVQEEQAIVFPNGTMHHLAPGQATFVSGDLVQPAGSTWAMMPMPPTLLGPCCLSGTHDNATTPNKCLPGDHAVAGGTCSNGACSPCPGTPGSDCSRCDQVSKVLPDRYKRAGVPQFPPPCAGCEGVDGNGYAVRDVVKIPASLPAGKYILSFRYDCEATAQVWLNCADVTLA